MKIKVLVVPTLIIVSGFVTLSYLKPDFDTYMQKRVLRDVAKANALQAETVAQNVQALKREATAQEDKVNFIKKYLPAEKDQGRTFDSLNFLISQSGLLTSKIQTAEIEEDATNPNVFGTLDPVADADPLARINSDDTTKLGGMPVAPIYTAPKIKRYSVYLEALGAYPNIKDVLSKLTTFDRAQEVKSFKIMVAETPEGEEASGNTLTLIYITELPYQPVPATLSGEAIVGIPGLNEGNFNFETVDAIRAAAAAVPDVALGTDGKVNPFVD